MNPGLPAAVAAASLRGAFFALVRRDLRGDGEVETAAVAEVDQSAGQPVGAECRVAVDVRDGAHGLGAEEPAARDDRVAADVVEPAAADVGAVADVGRIEVVVAEEHLHGAQLADAALAHHLAGADPLRVEAHHECFPDQHLLRGVAQRRRLVGSERDRLLAQHVLPGRGRLQRQRHVQVVGQRVVDRLDLGIGEQRLVRAVGAWNAECRGGGARTRLVPRRDRADLDERTLPHAGQDALAADLRRGEHAPDDRLHRRPFERRAVVRTAPRIAAAATRAGGAGGSARRTR